jgi:hypothetical protein
MRRIVLSDIDLTIRQQALSSAIMVVGIRVNKAVPRDKAGLPIHPWSLLLANIRRTLSSPV